MARTRGSRTVLAALAWALAASSAAPAAAPPEPSPAQEPAAEPAPAPGEIAATERFAFRSHPDLNLHHFLYQWASHEGEPPRRRRPPEVPERAELAALPEAERTVWQRAVDHYRAHLVERDLLFDDRMVALRDHLAGTGPLPEGEPAHSALAALAEARLIYERRWWPAHDSANRRWVEGVLPLLSNVEAGLAERLARSFGGSWPEPPIRIDVTAYANDQGAYTTDSAAGPVPHPVIGSLDPSYASPAGVEMVFHESCHWDTLIGAVRRALFAAAETAGAEVPRDYHHAVHFYTVGELAREAFAAAGVEGYVPFADANGIWERAPGWAPVRAACEKEWKPYLATGGGPGRNTAIARLARALAPDPEPVE